jgi:hypothetical protein
MRRRIVRTLTALCVFSALIPVALSAPAEAGGPCIASGTASAELGFDPTGSRVQAYQKGIFPRQQHIVGAAGTFNFTVDCFTPTTLWARPGPVSHGLSAKTRVAQGGQTGLVLIMPCVGSPAVCNPANLIVNPGFETGDFSGWPIVTMASVVPAPPGSGQFAAFLPGSGVCATRQFGQTIDVSAFGALIDGGTADLALSYYAHRTAATANMQILVNYYLGGGAGNGFDWGFTPTGPVDGTEGTSYDIPPLTRTVRIILTPWGNCSATQTYDDVLATVIAGS